MDHHYSDLLNEPPQSNAVLAGRIAELTRQNSTLIRDLELMKQDRDRLIDELAKRWPKGDRMTPIGQNGNTGEHYPAPVRYMVGSAIFQSKQSAIHCRNICSLNGIECGVTPLYAGQPLEIEKGGQWDV
jgi:hypothetical protein